MIELYDGGVYLLNGTELVADNGEAAGKWTRKKQQRKQ